jgi:hypothetical protein
VAVPGEAARGYGAHVPEAQHADFHASKNEAARLSRLREVAFVL